MDENKVGYLNYHNALRKVCSPDDLHTFDNSLNTLFNVLAKIPPEEEIDKLNEGVYREILNIAQQEIDQK